MNGMKRKLLIALTVVLLVAFAVLVVILSREPAQAIDPSKDYSKTAKPDSQVLSDSYAQPSLTTHSALSATSTPSSGAVTNATSPPGNQSPTITPSLPTGATASPVAPKSGATPQAGTKTPLSDPVGSLLQALGNIRL